MHRDVFLSTLLALELEQVVGFGGNGISFDLDQIWAGRATPVVSLILYVLNFSERT